MQPMLQSAILRPPIDQTARYMHAKHVPHVTPSHARVSPRKMNTPAHRHTHVSAASLPLSKGESDVGGITGIPTLPVVCFPALSVSLSASVQE